MDQTFAQCMPTMHAYCTMDMYCIYMNIQVQINHYIHIVNGHNKARAHLCCQQFTPLLQLSYLGITAGNLGLSSK